MMHDFDRSFYIAEVYRLLPKQTATITYFYFVLVDMRPLDGELIQNYFLNNVYSIKIALIGIFLIDNPFRRISSNTQVTGYTNFYTNNRRFKRNLLVEKNISFLDYKHFIYIFCAQLTSFIFFV